MVKRYGDVHRMFKFHHVDSSQKARDYGNLIRRNISTATLDEIDKCILLCGECHDILHAQSIDGHVKFVMQIAGRTAEQTIAGNFVFDARDKIMTFLSNERLYVVPYLMKVGHDGADELIFGTELNDAKMHQQLSALRESKTFTLYSYMDRRRVFRATLTLKNSVLVEYDISLNLRTALDPDKNNKEPNTVWVRNGVALKSDGTVLTSGNISFEVTQPFFL